MRPLFTGIILFLAWLVLSTWYYSTKIFPVLNPAEETTITETVPGTMEQPPEAAVVPEAPGGITLYFDFDKTAILNPGALRTWIPGGKEYLGAVAGACVQLDGHTCDIGTEAYNTDLGRRGPKRCNSSCSAMAFHQSAPGSQARESRHLPFPIPAKRTGRKTGGSNSISNNKKQNVMNLLATILAKTTTGAAIEIIIILLVAGAIAFITAYYYYRTVYLKRIGILEEEKAKLEREVTARDREMAELKARIAELEKK
jgi:uncharacterized MAPEG superfamily protein